MFKLKAVGKSPHPKDICINIYIPIIGLLFKKSFTDMTFCTCTYPIGV